MFAWLSANIGTILIVLVLLAVVIGIIVKLRKDKKKGVSPCGCNCAHCAMHGTCHPKKYACLSVQSQPYEKKGWFGRK